MNLDIDQLSTIEFDHTNWTKEKYDIKFKDPSIIMYHSTFPCVSFGGLPTGNDNIEDPIFSITLYHKLSLHSCYTPAYGVLTYFLD